MYIYINIYINHTHTHTHTHTQVRAYQEHTEQLSMLGSRVSNEENQLNAETLKLQQVLTYAHVCSRMLAYAHVC